MNKAINACCYNLMLNLMLQFNAHCFRVQTDVNEQEERIQKVQL